MSGLVAGPPHGVNRLVCIFGYSNNIGLMVPSAVTVYPGLTIAYDAVQQHDHIAYSYADPPGFNDDGPRTLSGRPAGHGVSYPIGSGGVELTLMRELHQTTRDNWTVIKMCIDSSSLINHWNNPAYPTGGPSILNQLITYIQDQAAAHNVTDLANNLVVVSMNGAVDTGSSYAAYLAALDSVFGTMRATLGNFYVVMERLTNQIDDARDIIAAQESFSSSDAGRTAFAYADDLALRGGGNQHYADDSYATLGVRLADRVRALFKGTAPTGPYVAAVGPITTASSAQALSFTMPRHTTNDILVAVTFAAHAATNYALSPDQGFVQVGSSPQSISGGARVAAWWVRATSDAMVAPTMPDIGGDDRKYGFIMVIRQATTSGNPFDATAGDTSSTNTAVTFPSVTTTSANRLILNILAHNIDSTGHKLDDWTNNALVELTEHVDYDTVASIGYGCCMASGRLVSAGAAGTTTGTLASTSTQARLTLAVTPA